MKECRLISLELYLQGGYWSRWVGVVEGEWRRLRRDRLALWSARIILSWIWRLARC